VGDKLFWIIIGTLVLTMFMMAFCAVAIVVMAITGGP
jgi:hypothetical protein